MWDSIVLDTIAPAGKVVVNGGAATTNSRTVTAALTASDNGSGVADMRFAFNRTDDAGFSQWEPFKTTKTLVLPNYQGTNWVSVQLRDRAGNIRPGTWMLDSIVLDTIAPTGKVVINGGAATTNSRTVTLALTASDNLSGVADMRFAVDRTDDAAYSAWEPFAASKTLTLPNYPGTHYVNVQLRDRAGNIRPGTWMYDSIELIAAAPASSAAASFRNQGERAVRVSNDILPPARRSRRAELAAVDQAFALLGSWLAAV